MEKFVSFVARVRYIERIVKSRDLFPQGEEKFGSLYRGFVIWRGFLRGKRERTEFGS